MRRWSELQVSWAGLRSHAPRFCVQRSCPRPTCAGQYAREAARKRRGGPGCCFQRNRTSDCWMADSQDTVMLTFGLLLIGALESASSRWEPLTLADAAAPQAAVGRAAETCVTLVSKGRLIYHTPFVAELTAGLELRLRLEADFGWRITVGRPGGMVDYMWVVSPPFRTAPHVQLGPVYGLSARESMAFVRELRFVLTDKKRTRRR